MSMHYSGELSKETLETEIDLLFNELAVACGHCVLGRTTELELTEETFSGDPVLLRLSSHDVFSTRRGKKTIVRPAVEHTAIVHSVLQKTHPDVVKNPKGMSALKNLYDIYTSLGDKDTDIQETLQDNLTSLLESEPPLPDLIRGVTAFGEAELHHWNGIYELTHIKPAMTMAAWIISYEQNEPLE